MTAQQTLALYGRLARQRLRAFDTWLTLVLSLFFLAIYTGLLGGADAVERVVGGDFLTFILPVAILNAAIAGSVAGQLLVADLESGYLRRQLTLPVSRVALVLAPMLVAATVVAAQALLVVVVGVAFGVSVASGPVGVLAILALAGLWGVAFAGYSVASGLLAGNAAAAQTAQFLFFPLIFVSPTFLPREQLQGWLEVAASANPTTYVLEAMRGLLLEGWDASQLALGFGLMAALCLLALWWASSVARRRTARG